MIISERTEVAPFLATLDLDYNELVEVIRYADRERALCTGNDPTGFEFVVMNSRAVRGLRERFCGERWKSDVTDNQPGICNPHREIRVIHCNFDKHAGDVHAMPSNLTEKGPASRVKVRCNRTAWLPGLPMPEGEFDRYTTYVLGTYFDQERGLRAELSRPVGFSSGQYIGFEPRVILLTGSEGSSIGGEQQSREPPTDIIDIDIKRR